MKFSSFSQAKLSGILTADGQSALIPLYIGTNYYVMEYL